MSCTCLAWAALAGLLRLAVQEGAILPAGLRPCSLLRVYVWWCMFVHAVSRVVTGGQGLELLRVLLGEEEEEIGA